MRDVNLLHPLLQEKARSLIDKCRAKGIEIIITQTLRTKAEQDALYAQGRTTPGAIVTNCRYPQSLHCWGVAFDVAVVKDGKATWETAYYKPVGLIGKTLGLEWGGDWVNFKDYPHFQMPGYSHSDLIAKCGTPERFIASWKEADEVGFEAQAKAEYNGHVIPAGILEGKTYIELRAAAELFSKSVAWDAATKTVKIADKS